MARETFGLRNVWTSDGRIFFVDENKKTFSFYDYIAVMSATKKRKKIIRT